MRLLVLPVAILASGALAQEPSITGQTGLISMPDARLAPDGTWRTGLSLMRPYGAIWTSVTMLPWLETSGRFTRIFNVPGFPPGPNIDYGDFKDKSFDVKLRVFDETETRPSLVIGGQDLMGTQVFHGLYVAGSKRFGDLDLTFGYGAKRFDGFFGGVRYRPPGLPSWSLVAEYDAFDYKRDHASTLSGSASYRKALAIAAEYKWEWLGFQLGVSHGKPVVNAYVAVPLQQRQFVPKLDEPAPYTRIVARPSEAQWQSDDAHRLRLARALFEQDYRDIRIGYENGKLALTLGNTRISRMPRAVGRAARTALAFAPLEAREISITYESDSLPVATYTFIELDLLRRYFNGMASRRQLAQYVAIEYAKPTTPPGTDLDEMLVAAEEPLPQHVVVTRAHGDFISLVGGDLKNRYHVRPALQTFLNDPSGVFKFDVSAMASYDHVFRRGLVFHSEAKLTLFENVSDVTQPSNSLLPHVRSDVAEYKKGGRFKVIRALVNRFDHPAERVYTRLSAGIYEEMFSGAGGQVLYLPKGGRWGADLAVDWLKQRDFRGLFGHREYSTLTAIASLNYRMAKDVTATLRAGRFLAKDEGVRVELKRRFHSGFEVGAWYSHTNGNDITSPGSPLRPYRDKGIFMSMPLETMLTRDTRATAGFALAPWTRDVGQMVASPGDLWRMLERPLVFDLHYRDGLAMFGDREDDYELPELGPSTRERRWPEFVVDDAFNFGRAVAAGDWWHAGAFAGAAVLASALLDKRAERFAADHREARWMKNGVRLGNALPVLALGASAVFAFDESRPRLSDAGVAALEAGAVALLAAKGLKYAAGRARPDAGLGRADFSPGSSQHARHSMPSERTAVMWAAVTPYAEEFGMPWLYGVAAVTNLARVGSRKHWLSDTVGGALLGYAAGRLAWEARRETRNKGPKLSLSPQGVELALAFE